MYELRFCKIDEIDKLQFYIKENIRADELLANDLVFVDWFYKNEIKNYYNCLLAVHKETNEIHGFFGIIPIYNYDDELYPENEIWASNFSVKSSERGKGIGKQLLIFIDEKLDKQSFGSPGISEMVFPLFIKLGFKTGYLNHYYILNNEVESYAIAGNTEGIKMNYKPAPRSHVFEEVYTLDDINIEISNDIKPKKSLRYIINRYFKHPVFKYRFFVIKKGSECLSLLVMRKMDVDNSSCFRIFDIIGDFSAIKYARFDLLIKKEQAEYIDCLNYGLEEKIFYDAGFMIKEGEVIIPEHFYPFEKKNIPINFAYKYDGQYVIFKGDASLDRPR